jgi:uncharacterized integral membrane protein
MKAHSIYAFFTGLAAGGLATWFQPNQQLEIFGIDYRTIMALAALLFAFGYKYFTDARTSTTGLFVGLGVTIALLLRILINFLTGSTMYAPWRFEIAVYVLIAFPSALIGAYAAELIFGTNK